MWELAIGVSFLAVIGMKLRTSIGLRDLERRLRIVQKGLKEKKEEYKSKLDRQEELSTEEQLYVNRVRFTKEIIQDITNRLNSNTDTHQASNQNSEDPIIPYNQPLLTSTDIYEARQNKNT